ncbi:MAG: hypothetical protein QG656_1846 [Candidatus Hydrogenedentes bacterium]|nr:hypothetical protein [Candidatus Hydrogenedentota bacterium]
MLAPFFCGAMLRRSGARKVMLYIPPSDLPLEGRGEMSE